MHRPYHVDDSTGRQHEVIFCVFLVGLVFLCRDNAELVYPQILFLFVALLSLNLLASWSLKMWPSHPGIATGVILSNCAVITAILCYSGGASSNLWVLYLLPIYTVCLLLRGKQVAVILTGIISFNLAFHYFLPEIIDQGSNFNLFLKLGIYLFAAGAKFTLVLPCQDQVKPIAAEVPVHLMATLL